MRRLKPNQTHCWRHKWEQISRRLQASLDQKLSRSTKKTSWRNLNYLHVYDEQDANTNGAAFRLSTISLRRPTVASIHPSDCLKTIFSWNRRRQEWPSLHDDLKIWRLSHQTFSSMKGFFSYSNFTSMEGTMWTWTKLEHSTSWKNNGYLDVRGRSLSTGGTPNPTKWQDVVGHDLILSKTGSWNGLLSAK